MIALLVACGFGFLFGYGLVGPIATTYSAKAYFPLVTFVVFLIGFMAFVAVVLQGFVTGTEIMGLGTLLASLGGWLVYSAAIGAGVSVRVARR